MCYLLLGNISALISDDSIEPLVNARLRVYLPETGYPTHYHPKKNIFNGPGLLTAAQVAAKSDRLLAETRLDEKGNFMLTWEQLHLFTEPLELDICLHHSPEQGNKEMDTHYHLSRLVPHWKRSGLRYVAAYAYVIPADSWRQIRANYGTWVIAGTVRKMHTREGQPQLKVEVYNAGNHRLLGYCGTDENGRYQLRFSRKELAGRFTFVNVPRQESGPDVYFKIYRNNQLLWEEHEDAALMPGRRAIPSCSIINIVIPPQTSRNVPGKTPGLTGWLSNLSVTNRKRSLVS